MVISFLLGVWSGEIGGKVGWEVDVMGGGRDGRWVGKLSVFWPG